MNPSRLEFYGGQAGALAPFVLFLTGVAWLGLSGAPDEKGFWPVLLAALALGLLVTKDRTGYSEVVIRGMSQPIVILMIMAWLLAGVLGTIMAGTGFVEALVWLARQTGVSGGGYVAAAFLICCGVSTSTGTSIGTILLCGPLLYPAGSAMSVEPAVLMGAILGGAVFGDNVSPISDTTIASALTQDAQIGEVVRSRLKYALPAAGVSLVFYAALGGSAAAAGAGSEQVGSPQGLPMVVAPALTVWLLLARRHLLEGLLSGILAAAAIGLALGLLEPSELLYIDSESFSAKGIVLEGLERGVGASIFTLFLMGMVASIEAAGILGRVVEFARKRTASPRGAEFWIFGTVSAAVAITTHSAVAILTVGQFTRETGERFKISPSRRANLLDVTVCSFPFNLPYFVPVILAASTSASGVDFGMPRISPFETGFNNYHSWMLLIVVVLAIVTGFGRRPKPVGQEELPL